MKKTTTVRNPEAMLTSRLRDSQKAKSNTQRKSEISVKMYATWTLSKKVNTHQNTSRIVGYWNAPNPWPKANVWSSKRVPNRRDAVKLETKNSGSTFENAYPNSQKMGMKSNSHPQVIARMTNAALFDHS